MPLAFRKAMDALYLACVLVAGSCFVLISLIIPWGVYTRYVLNSASSWPEPTAILLAIVLTFFGAAACYRTGTHMRVTFVADIIFFGNRRAAELVSESLVALVGFFMVIWGSGLCQTTWHQTIAEIPSLSVGVTYLPIPISGVITVLFVLERLIIGPPARDEAAH